MKNSDMPANPTPYMDQASASGELYCDNTWLSKREKFAAMAMQGCYQTQSLEMLRCGVMRKSG